MQGAARIFVLGGDTLEHVDLVSTDERRAIRLGDREVGEILARGAGEHGVTDGCGRHDGKVPVGNFAMRGGVPRATPTAETTTVLA